MSVIAKSSDSSHWYSVTGIPCYETPYADPSKGMRPTTLRDAKKLGLLASVTTILRVLHKQALVEWMIEQACLAVLTAPRLENEPLDAFVNRVLNVEKQQDQEAQKARELGTRIHDALEQAVMARWYPDDLNKYVLPVLDVVKQFGRVVATEKILVGQGYAGKTDLIMEGDSITILDFKTTKKVPKQSYDEHMLQTSAYAKAYGATGDKRIRTANIYISTTEPGLCALFIQDDWLETFEQGFKPVLHYWQWVSGMNSKLTDPAP